jgi:hypothetical protein
MLMPSSQNEEVQDNYSTPSTKDPPEDKTTAVIDVMRGKPKDGCHHHCCNKHYKQKLVRVMLDSGSYGNLIFVNKDKPNAASLLKMTGSTVVEYFKWDPPDNA